jgi:hypothetical protein
MFGPLAASYSREFAKLKRGYLEELNRIYAQAQSPTHCG